MDFLGENRANLDVRSALSPQGKMQSRLLKLSRFLKGRKVWTVEPHPDAMRKTKGGRRRERIIEEIVPKGAADYSFPWKEGGYITIQACCLSFLLVQHWTMPKCARTWFRIILQISVLGSNTRLLSV